MGKEVDRNEDGGGESGRSGDGRLEAGSMEWQWWVAELGWLVDVVL